MTRWSLTLRFATTSEIGPAPTVVGEAVTCVGSTDALITTGGGRPQLVAVRVAGAAAAGDGQQQRARSARQPSSYLAWCSSFARSPQHNNAAAAPYPSAARAGKPRPCRDQNESSTVASAAMSASSAWSVSQASCSASS